MVDSVAVGISLLVIVAYFVFYTAFSKTSRKLELELLVTVLTVGKSIDHTLVEINKVISLAGLTVLALAFIPGFTSHSQGLLWSAMVLLWLHALYSTYKYYGDKNFPVVTSFVNLFSELSSSATAKRCAGVKKTSIVLGLIGQVVLSAGYWDFISRSALCYLGLALGISHFYFMEIDYKYVLQVRPFAYLPFPLAACAIMFALYNHFV